MANVICSCAKCSSELGRFRNSWTGIGNSYFSPLCPPLTYINGFEPTGELFAKGSDGSAVQNSVLQDLACRKCHKVVGLICNAAPAGHILKKNQLILRLAEMHVVSEQTGEEAIISVQQKIPLMPLSARKHPTIRRAATLQPVLRQETPNLIARETEAMCMDGTEQAPAQGTLYKEATGLATMAEDVLQTHQQVEIDRINRAVNRIERDMTAFQDFMIEVQAELEANRATRKTQQMSNQEQLAWLQDDLRELRQENGKFRQDLWEGELPGIRKRMDRLREDLDSQSQANCLSSDISVSRSMTKINTELLFLRQKANENDELKMELQQLWKHLNNVEQNRQSSFVSPRILGSPNQSWHAGSLIPQMPTLPQPRSPIALQAPDDCNPQSTTLRQNSPARDLPGAFPDSLVDSTPRNNILITAKKSLSVLAQSRRPAHRLESARNASTRPPLTRKWSYTGLHQRQVLKTAFEAFNLKYPKLGVPQSIGVLENHVNNSSLDNTGPVLSYGKMTINDEDMNACSPDLSKTESSQLKRKHDLLEATLCYSSSENPRKKRRQAGMTTEVKKHSKNFDQILKSPSADTSEARRFLATSSTYGSPELGQDSRLQSRGSVAIFKGLINSAQTPEMRYDVVGTLGGSAIPVQGSFSNKENKAQVAHQRQISPDELENMTTIVNHGGLPSVTKRSMTNSRTSTMLKSFDTDHTSIPGAFPSDIKDAEAATHITGTSNVPSKTIPAFDPRLDKAKHFKCGSCGKRYRNPGAFKYHKTHSSCKDDPRDEVPKNFECPFCRKELKWNGLVWHLSNVACSGNKTKENEEIPNAAHGREITCIPAPKKSIQQTPGMDKQTRKEVLEQRERLVRETLEREM